MEKKYEFTGEELKISPDTTLKRIGAIRSFEFFTYENTVEVKSGDSGGWIEREENLSHEGSCWVYDNAMVYDWARIFEDAKVFGNA